MPGAPSFGVTGAAVSSPRPSALRHEWTSGRARVSKGPHGTQQFSRSDFLEAQTAKTSDLQGVGSSPQGPKQPWSAAISHCTPVAGAGGRSPVFQMTKHRSRCRVELPGK